MARKGRRPTGDSSYTYFKNLFTANPQMLEERSNVGIFAKYREDHGLAEDAELDKTVRGNMANVKSTLRKKLLDKKRGGKKAVLATISTRGGNRLDTLEEMIDDCLTWAKNIGKEEMGDVISRLRSARNLVVLKGGA